MTRWRRPPVLLLALAVLLLAATFTRPILRLETATYRYLFVFDITQSMNVVDVPLAAPSQSRLDYAKQTALQALIDLPCGTEAGLALFSGHRAFLLLTPIEVCAHYRELSAVLDNISWRMNWERRSEVAKGVHKSISLAQQMASETRLVFLTDGHEAPPIDPALPPLFRGESGAIKGLLVGVGGDEPVPIPKFDRDGSPAGYWQAADFVSGAAATSAHLVQADASMAHLSAVHEAYLQGLAGETGLTYLRLRDAQSLARRIKSDELGIPAVTTVDVRWLLALGALLAFSASLVCGAAREGPP